MSKFVGRSAAVDFVRGIAVIVIALDHISNGVLQNFTLHRYAYCDAAEVFVFVAGYASAAGYLGIAVRNGQSVAKRRFLNRAAEIYCAYLATAALMIGCSAMLALMHPTPPSAVGALWPAFMHHPVHVLADIASFREQPFLSAVLPMYVLFSMCVPLAVPFARFAPASTLIAGFAVWGAAPLLGRWLPAADGSGWSFNPFAWQLMFVFGILSRMHPIPDRIQVSRLGKCVTGAAVVVAATLACIKLCLDVHPSPGCMKQDLASVRIVSFLSLAWLFAQAKRLQWVSEIAATLTAVTTVGRQGLVGFIGGTVISIAIDAALHVAGTRMTGLWTDGVIRLGGDLMAIVALLALTWVSSRVQVRKQVHPCADSSSSPSAQRSFQARTF